MCGNKQLSWCVYVCACTKSCVPLLPEAEQMMRDHELHASTLLSNNESAVIA